MTICNICQRPREIVGLLQGEPICGECSEESEEKVIRLND